MAGNSLEQDIIELYSTNPSSLYSINQIATKLGKKYPYINKKVSILIKENIFKKTIVGRSHLCSLNLSNDETINLLALNEIKRKKQHFDPKLSKNIRFLEYCYKLSKSTGLLAILKFKNTIYFVVETETNKETLEKTIVSQMLAGFSFTILTKERFLSMLKESIEFQEEKTLIFGFEKYYQIIKEIEDELRIRYSKLTI